MLGGKLSLWFRYFREKQTRSQTWGSDKFHWTHGCYFTWLLPISSIVLSVLPSLKIHIGLKRLQTIWDNTNNHHCLDWSCISMSFFVHLTWLNEVHFNMIMSQISQIPHYTLKSWLNVYYLYFRLSISGWVKFSFRPGLINGQF